MPESTLDRLLLVLGVCALAGLIALIVPAWRDYASGDNPAGPANPPVAVAPSKAEVTRPAPRARPVSPPATTVTRSPPAGKPVQPTVAKLRLVAAKGDCWVEARSGSASGRQLYYGMLGQGKTVKLSARVVWLRLGAPQNLAGWIGSKPVRDFPSSAATVVVTRAGVRTLSLG